MEPSFDSRALHSVLVLFLLAVRSTLGTSFPTFASKHPPADTAEPDFWLDPLNTALQTTTSRDLGEALRWILHRIAVTRILDPDTYTTFVKAEHEQSSPVDAYVKHFRPLLDPGVGQFLDEVFGVWTSIVEYSDAVTIRRISMWLGWWTWGLGRKSRVLEWKQLYQQWLKAGRGMEHILYAWIR